MSLSPENLAIAIRELGSIQAGLFDQDDKVNRLMDAARSSSTPLVGVEEVARIIEEYLDHAMNSVIPEPWDVRHTLSRQAAQAILSKIQGQEGGSAGGRLPAAPNGATDNSAVSGWKPADVRVQYDLESFARALREHVGFWGADFRLKYLDIHIDTRVPTTFTLSDRDKNPVTGEEVARAMRQWRESHPTPAKSSAGQPSEASASALATDEPPLPSPDQPLSDGWVMVPREPTRHMIKASVAALINIRRNGGSTVHNTYQKHAVRLRAAIAAAPPAQTTLSGAQGSEGEGS